MIIDGKKIANQIIREVQTVIESKQLQPHLAVVLVGTNPGSEIYVRLKQKRCEQVGIHFHLHRLPENTSEKELVKLISKFNKDKKMNAILVQLPLPKQFDKEATNRVIESISPEKDVDGFHPKNIERFLQDDPFILPGLSNAVMELIKATNENIEGKKGIIVSNNEIFSIPIIKILKNHGCNAKWISSKDEKLKSETKKADIFVVAIGKANYFKADMIKKDSIIVDVGINRLKSNKVVGDVDYESVKDKIKHITPVPGGVGPITIALLIKNTLFLYEHQK